MPNPVDPVKKPTVDIEDTTVPPTWPARATSI
jgi:hypothetical protein